MKTYAWVVYGQVPSTRSVTGTRKGLAGPRGHWNRHNSNTMNEDGSTIILSGILILYIHMNNELTKTRKSRIRKTCSNSLPDRDYMHIHYEVSPKHEVPFPIFS